jgi:ribose transport system permease protein
MHGAALVITFIAVCVVFTIASPYFFTLQNIENIGRQASVLLILSFGITFVMIARELDISIGAVLAVTSMLVAMLLDAGVGIVPAIGLGIGIGFVIGAINGMLTIGGLPSFLVTLAMLSLGRGLALTVTDGAPVPVTNTHFREYVGQLEVGPVPIITVVTVVVGIVAHLVLSKTVFGRRIYAVGGNPEAARVAGVPVKQTVLLAFVISGVLAAIAGIMSTGRSLAATPLIAQGIELDAIAAVVLGGTKLTGGRGSIPGTVVGALMIAVITNGLTILGFSQGAQMMIKGGIILVALALDLRTKK